MTRHPLSIAGAWLVTLSAFVFLFVLFLELVGFHTNPYLGIVFFLILPAFFIVGLLMIPAGVILERRRLAKGLQPHRLPKIDLNNPVQQRAVGIFIALSVVNVLIVSLAAYRGVEYMDSPRFCGQVCHTVMEPEFVANQTGPHARVACVDCHIGEGAASFVYYKLNGLRQLVHLVRDTYPRPVPSPVFNLRPARNTCEMCHWSEKYHGDKAVTIPSYGDDEKSSESPTQMTVHVGTGSTSPGAASGAHWHANPTNRIEFVSTDEKRETIPYVRMTDRDGKVHEYRAGEVTDAQIAAGTRRQMDCIDCHNRPTHAFSASAERAVDAAIARGDIARTLPFVRKQAVEVLTTDYPDRNTGDRTIAERLRTFYAGAGGAGSNKADVDHLVAAVQQVYGRNVFPAMKVTWGSHANNLGHTDSPGCFRCHDDEHKSADGRVISQDCELCHAIQ